MRDYKNELKSDLEFGRKNNLKVILVESDSKKGFNYSYFLYLPNNPQSTLMVNCLNDYEEKMDNGQIENVEGMVEVYNLFKASEIIRSNPSNFSEKEESKEKTLDRMYYRLEKGINELSVSIKINPNAPIIIPLIPGYSDEKFGNVISQLDKDVIKETAPQIKAMREYAKGIIEERTNIKMSEKVVLLGHSKSATFANNFSAYYPEMCDATILGGGNFGTLPINEIVLNVVDDDVITDNEKFKLLNGKVTKNIKKSDLDTIIKEYNNTKREYQKDIEVNEDGTYNLPINFPVGIADIEHYKDFSNLSNGKENYKKALLNMRKMIFIGENEDVKPGHYAYLDGKTFEGIDVKAGDDILLLEKKLGRLVNEIETASMHNRVLEYVVASNILFGRSSNERLKSYMQLNSILNVPIQSKIYEGVEHTSFNYSDEIDGLDKIDSKNIYESKALNKDIALYYDGVIKGTTYILGDNERAKQISPVPQIIRRYITSGKDIKLIFDVSEKEIIDSLEQYMNLKNMDSDKNLDRLYDNISADEIESIFKTIKKNQVVQEGKSGLDDCMQDENLRISTEQEITKIILETVLEKKKNLDEELQR